ncbi:MAG TPA: hypothetical protein VF832_13845 [Longimicrobiales bacterium]
MPVNAASLIANRAHASATFEDGQILHFDYYPKRITVDMLPLLTDAVRLSSLPQARQLEVIVQVQDLLPRLIAAWDFTETAEDGSEQPLPIDVAHLAPLGVAIQWAILGGILAAQAGAATSEGAVSAEGKSAAAAAPAPEEVPVA